MNEVLNREARSPATEAEAAAIRALLESGRAARAGYLLIPSAHQQLARGDGEAALAAAAAAIEVARACGDRDLLALACGLQARALLRGGKVKPGLALLDEVMESDAAARASGKLGELSPLVRGAVTCGAIASCHEVYALGRALEWTSMLSAWCDGEPELVALSGVCLAHRVQMLSLTGAWSRALDEAHRAAETFASDGAAVARADAYYQAAEVHRFRGELVLAEAAYAKASRAGAETQPGLALLSLARGRGPAALAGLRRVLDATPEPLRRVRSLPALVEVLLSEGDLQAAEAACIELEHTAARFGTEVLWALADEARGARELAGKHPERASRRLRRAFETWRDLGAPHATARLQVLVGLACRAQGDEDGLELELTAARRAFERLGAAPDLARIDALRRGARPAARRGLTRRELEVLRLVAAGHTNQAIAERLRLSEAAIDSRVSHVFAKLGVPSRAAATAYAYAHELQ